MVSLYVKCQMSNNIQYFGKTINDNPYSYKGSGKVWKDIHKKYQWSDVATMVVGEFEIDDPMLIDYALGFSAANDIVNSKDWANLIVETGDSSGPRLFGEANGFFGKHHTDESRQIMSQYAKDRVVSDETKQKTSETLLKNPPFKGRTHSDESRKKQSESAKLRLQNPENHPLFGTTVSDERKARQIQTLKKTMEDNPEIAKEMTKGLMSTEALVCPHCGKSSKSKGNMARWHFDKCKQKD